MYGYAEAKEIALYTEATKGLDALINLECELSNAATPDDRLSKTAELLFRIRTIRNTLAMDGTVWESRPYDLLAIQAEGKAVSMDKVVGSTPFNRLLKWEKLTAFFRFEDAFVSLIKARAAKDKRANKDDRKSMEDYIPDVLSALNEDILKELEKPLSALAKALHRLKDAPAERKKYDIFDNAISYTERIARWQEYKPEGDNSLVRIPISVADTCEKSSYPYELALLTTMLFQHLRHIGIKRENLTGKDFWRIPGGKEGLGAYQRASTAETFFSRVQASIRALDKSGNTSPIHLLSLNNEWMANMEPDVFTAFCNSKAEPAPDQPPGGAPSQPQFDPQSPFASYGRVLLPKPDQTKAPKSSDAYLLDCDGTLSASLLLQRTLSRKRAAPAIVISSSPFTFLTWEKWSRLKPKDREDFWNRAYKLLNASVKEMLADGKSKSTKSFTLNWPKNASKNLESNVSWLMLGYLCYLSKQKPGLEFTMPKVNPGEKCSDFLKIKKAKDLMANDCKEKYREYQAEVMDPAYKDSVKVRVTASDDGYAITLERLHKVDKRSQNEAEG